MKLASWNVIQYGFASINVGSWLGANRIAGGPQSPDVGKFPGRGSR